MAILDSVMSMVDQYPKLHIERINTHKRWTGKPIYFPPFDPKDPESFNATLMTRKILI